MRPWRIHFGRETNVKNNKIPGSKNTAAASSSKHASGICLEEPAEEKGEKNIQRGPGAGTSIQVPGTYHMKDTFDNQPRTNLRRSLLQKAMTTRDRCVAHMLLRSCRDVRRPRHLPNTKFTTVVQSHPDGTAKSTCRTTVYRRPPDRGDILKSSKK